MIAGEWLARSDTLRSDVEIKMGHLGSLLCGHQNKEGIAKKAMDQLANSLDSFSSRAVKYLREPASDDSQTFGPFCARVILENGCAALVGRLDCFRVLYLSEFQSQSEYAPGKRAKSAFSWTGDVIPDDRASDALWSVDHDLAKISRALFSRHLDHVYWRPAVEHMLDFASAREPTGALADILTLDAETYIGTCRGRSQQLYSMLSKGVHWEFFTSALLFDDATVKSAIRDSCLLMAHLGLASHFIPTAYASLTPDAAVEAYISFRQDVP